MRWSSLQEIIFFKLFEKHFGLLNFLGVAIVITAEKVILSNCLEQVLRWRVRCVCAGCPSTNHTNSTRGVSFLFLNRFFWWINKAKSCLILCFLINFYELLCPGKILPNHICSSSTHKWHVHLIDTCNVNVQSNVSLLYDCPEYHHNEQLTKLLLKIFNEGVY